ncbi:MAG: hypothetical protein ACM3ZE_25120, partial [Myxococcales bacterium]
MALVCCDGRHPTLTSKPKAAPELPGVTGTVAQIDLTSGAPESTSAGGEWFPLPATRTFTGLIRSVERLEADRDVRAVLVRLGTQRLNFPQVEEIGRLMAGIRRSRPVICHAHTLTNATLWLTLQ